MATAAPTPDFLRQQRILIVEDHAAVRAGLLAEFAANLPDAQVRMAADEARARKEFDLFNPTLCLVDLILGGARSLADGIGLIEDLARSASGTAILVYSAVEDADLARRALAAGARGFIAKSEPMENLHLALSTVMAGRVYLSPAVFVALGGGASRSPTLKLDPRFASLTNRERHVLHATALGQPNRRIAADLGLSVKTIESHKDALKRKLALDTASELEAVSQTYLAALLGVSLA